MTTTPATQAILPVTPENMGDRRMVNIVLAELLAPYIPDLVERMRIGNVACSEILSNLARHRQAHSLPGDVGRNADAQRSIVRAVIDCYNTARPAGLSPVEYVHSKRLVRDAFAALSNVSVQIEQEELLDLIDDAISDSFDEEWNSRMGARHIVGALEHEGLAVVPLAALTPSARDHIGDVNEMVAVPSALIGDAGEGE